MRRPGSVRSGQYEYGRLLRSVRGPKPDKRQQILEVELGIRPTMYGCPLIGSNLQIIERRSSFSPMNSVMRVCGEHFSKKVRLDHCQAF